MITIHLMSAECFVLLFISHGVIKLYSVVPEFTERKTEGKGHIVCIKVVCVSLLPAQLAEVKHRHWQII